MGKGVGIAALVSSIVAIFIPIVGIFVGWTGLVLAVLAALAGDKVLAIATVAISIVDFIFLSPSLWLATAGANLNPGPGSPNAPLIITVVLIIAPIGAIALHATGKLVIGK